MTAPRPYSALKSALLLGLIVLTSASGCDKNKGAIPATAEGRITQMATHLPASTEAALFVGDLGELRVAMNHLGALGEAIPELTATQKQIEAQIGFDPLDANAWKQAGVPDNSAITAAFVNNRTVVMVYVEDRQKFDTTLTQKLQRSLDVSEAPKSKAIGDRQIKVLGEGDSQVAWLHDGKLAILASNVLNERFTVGDQSAAPEFLATLAATELEQSASKNPQFLQFTKGMTADYAVSAYANIQMILKNESFRKQIEEEQDPSTLTVLKRLEKEAQVAALGLKKEANTFTVTAFYGADEETNKELRQLGVPTAKSPLGPFAHDKLMIGARTALDMEKLWAYYLKNTPEAQRAQIEQTVQDVGQAAQIDLLQDLINKLSGNIGVYLYGFDAGKIMQDSSPANIIANLDGALVMQFKDGAALDALLGKFDTALPSDIVTEQGVRTLAMPNGLGNLYAKGDLLVYGTQVMRRADALSFIQGTSSRSPLSGLLGEQFSSTAPYGGVYVNVDKLSAILGLLLMGSPVGDALNQIKELALTTEANEAGISLNLRLTITPPPVSEKAAPATE